MSFCIDGPATVPESLGVVKKVSLSLGHLAFPFTAYKKQNGGFFFLLKGFTELQTIMFSAWLFNLSCRVTHASAVSKPSELGQRNMGFFILALEQTKCH